MTCPPRPKRCSTAPTSAHRDCARCWTRSCSPGRPATSRRRSASSATFPCCPTSAFFYGLVPGDEVEVALEAGVSLYLALDAIGEADEGGFRSVFCRLNGQPRVVTVRDRSVKDTRPRGERAQSDNPAHVAAPFAGAVSLTVGVGDRVEAGPDRGDDRGDEDGGADHDIARRYGRSVSPCLRWHRSMEVTC